MGHKGPLLSTEAITAFPLTYTLVGLPSEVLFDYMGVNDLQRSKAPKGKDVQENVKVCSYEQKHKRWSGSRHPPLAVLPLTHVDKHCGNGSSS